MNPEQDRENPTQSGLDRSCSVCICVQPIRDRIVSDDDERNLRDDLRLSSRDRYPRTRNRFVDDPPRVPRIYRPVQQEASRRAASPPAIQPHSPLGVRKSVTVWFYLQTVPCEAGDGACICRRESEEGIHPSLSVILWSPDCICEEKGRKPAPVCELPWAKQDHSQKPIPAALD